MTRKQIFFFFLTSTDDSFFLMKSESSIFVEGYRDIVILELTGPLISRQIKGKHLKIVGIFSFFLFSFFLQGPTRVMSACHSKLTNTIAMHRAQRRT